MPRSGDTQGRKFASQGANGQAYVPSEVSGILSSKNNLVKDMRHSFNIKKSYYSYGKINVYARPKITFVQPTRGGGLNEN